MQREIERNFQLEIGSKLGLTLRQLVLPNKTADRHFVDAYGHEIKYHHSYEEEGLHF